MFLLDMKRRLWLLASDQVCAACLIFGVWINETIFAFYFCDFLGKKAVVCNGMSKIY